MSPLDAEKCIDPTLADLIAQRRFELGSPFADGAAPSHVNGDTLMDRDCVAGADSSVSLAQGISSRGDQSPHAGVQAGGVPLVTAEGNGLAAPSRRAESSTPGSSSRAATVAAGILETLVVRTLANGQAAVKLTLPRELLGGLSIEVVNRGRRSVGLVIRAARSQEGEIDEALSALVDALDARCIEVVEIVGDRYASA